MMLYNAHYNRL